MFTSPHDLPRLGQLKGDADFWFFVDDPWLADAADDTSIRLHHLAERDWTPQLVANSVVEKAALALGRFCALLNDTDESPAHGLAGPAEMLFGTRRPNQRIQRQSMPCIQVADSTVRHRSRESSSVTHARDEC